MKSVLRQRTDSLIVIILLLFALYTRFLNINWGAPFYFHPDERNIASSVAQLRFPDQMNPHFFAYGSLPIYTTYLIGILWNVFEEKPALTVSFDQAIVAGRILSALLSFGVTVIIFLISKKLHENSSHLSLFLAATSIGLIQYAHFSTFEMWIAALSLLLFIICISLLKIPTAKYIVYAGILSGLLLATKVSSIVLFSCPIIAIILYHAAQNNRRSIRLILNSCLQIFFFCIVAVAVFSLFSPFVFFDAVSFRESMAYESSVALGTLPVFYTGEFFQSVPILFHLTRIYPFLLNPFITVFFIVSFFYTFLYAIKTKNRILFLLISFYLVLFLPQAVLFAKWTRYIVPTLPFVYLIISLALTVFIQNIRSKISSRHVILIQSSLLSIICISGVLFAVSFLFSTYAKEDSRIQAALFAKNNISEASHIVSESYDLGIIAFNPYLRDIQLFNFYDLDNANIHKEALSAAIDWADYIILPSQRIAKTRLTQPSQFPNGHQFYTRLFDGSLGFKKIYETPCSLFCKITYLGNPFFSYEQTASAFDRPTVLLFKKSL